MMPGALGSITDSAFRAVFDVTVLGTLLTVQQALPLMPDASESARAQMAGQTLRGSERADNEVAFSDSIETRDHGPMRMFRALAQREFPQ
jgi:NAD(P)-dependent dehydrogenase (short-subunit alcohol dehydrogenase family)